MAEGWNVFKTRGLFATFNETRGRGSRLGCSNELLARTTRRMALLWINGDYRCKSLPTKLKYVSEKANKSFFLVRTLYSWPLNNSEVNLSITYSQPSYLRFCICGFNQPQTIVMYLLLKKIHRQVDPGSLNPCCSNVFIDICLFVNSGYVFF